MRLYIIVLLSTLALVACDEPYTIEPQETDPVYIIEGLLTDEFKQHYINVSSTIRND